MSVPVDHRSIRRGTIPPSLFLAMPPALSADLAIFDEARRRRDGSSPRHF
jgi:hypothetical protein